jgi:hypothetical protein
VQRDQILDDQAVATLEWWSIEQMGHGVKVQVDLSSG